MSQFGSNRQESQGESIPLLLLWVWMATTLAVALIIGGQFWN